MKVQVTTVFTQNEAPKELKAKEEVKIKGDNPLMKKL
jgi:hypothetical protein